MIRMLIVDDERIHIDGIEMLVRQQQLPLKTFRAENGKEALQILQNHSIDILFTDIKMPIMDGIALSEEAVQINPAITIIIYSSFNEFEYAQKAIRLGVKNYILKPIRVSEFVECINKVLLHCRQEQSRAARDLILRELDHPDPQARMLWEPGTRAVLIDLCTEKNMSLIYDILQKITEEMPECLSLGLNEYQILLLCNMQSAEMEKRLNRIIQMSEEQYHHNLLVLIGEPMFERSDLKTTYNKFEDREDIRFFMTQSKVLYVNQSEDRGDFMSDKEQDEIVEISNHVIRGEYTSAEIRINRLFAHYMGNMGYQSLSLKFLCSEIVRNSLSHLQIHDVQALSNRTVSTIYSSVNIHELKSLMITFIQSHSSWRQNQNTDDDKAIQQVLGIIQQEYMNDLSLEILAEKVFLSPSYLSFLFKKETGKNFMKYLTEYRINQAKMLLTNTNEKVTYICKKVGYNNISYFCMIFRNYCGVTPAQYREQNLC